MNSERIIRWIVLLALCLAAALSYLARNSLAVMVASRPIATALASDEENVLGIRATRDDLLGWALGAFFVTYAIFQVPAAWVVRSWGSRISLTVFAASWGLCTALCGCATDWLGLLGARLGLGAAQAGVFTACTQTIARWFPADSRAFPSGALASAMSLGGALALAATQAWLDAFGGDSWRNAFFVSGSLALVWAVAFVVGFRESPHGSPEDRAGSPVAELKNPPTPWRAILTSPAMGWIALQQFFRAAGYMFFASWFPRYLQETRGVDTAGFLGSIPLLAVVAGSLCGGSLSDSVLRRTGSRRWARQGVAVLSLGATAVLAGLAYPVADATMAVLLISTGQFCHALAGPCAYAITIDMGGRHVPVVFSLMNMAGNLGAVAFPIVVPRLVALGGWDLILPFYGVIALGAALSWVFLDPRGSVVANDSTEN